MDQAAELWTRPINFAVVQLPGRAHPGVVVQGDTLNTLVVQLAQMQELLGSARLEDLAAELEDLRERLTEVRTFYEAVCNERGVRLPYPSGTS